MKPFTYFPFFIGCGLCVGLTALSGYFIPIIRNVEDVLPDHDRAQAAV